MPQQSSFVISDENILGGEVILINTRTPVRAIIEMRRLCYTPEQMIKRLPHLNLEQINNALDYYHEHPAEINAAIARNRVPHYLIDSLVKQS